MTLRIIDASKARIGYDFFCDIAINIVNKRKKLEITQGNLAEITKIKPGRMQKIESVQARITLEEVKRIAEALDVTVNNLINAELDSQIGECEYLLWLEGYDDLMLRQDATSKQMAFLLMEQYLNQKGLSWFGEARARVFVELWATPVTDTELKDVLSKYKEDLELLPDEE